MGQLDVVRAIHKSSGQGQCHMMFLVMVYMTDGGVTVKSTCNPHTSRRGGPDVSYICVLVFVSVLERGVWRCVSVFGYLCFQHDNLVLDFCCDFILTYSNSGNRFHFILKAAVLRFTFFCSEIFQALFHQVLPSATDKTKQT